MTKKKNEAEIAAEDAEGVWGHLLDFPKSSLKENAMYLFLAPITWPLALTCGLKDVRIPGNEGWCFYEFFTSVAWIGGYAYVLVGWVETFGATLGIPSVVMGLTILAAGTSIPDLLSSVVVARAGTVIVLLLVSVQG
jgi:Ca2+/Na+ antiporter